MPSSWAVLWDVDGTLVDTGELHFQAWSALCQERGLPFSRADFDATFGWRNVEIIPKLFGSRFTPDESAVMGDRKEELYRAAARRGVELLPGARTLMSALHAIQCRQAIGSSAPRANVDLILELTAVQPFIHAIVSMEDVRRGKPDPEVFLRAAERLRLPPARCVVMEDAPVGIQAAKAGGMRCIGVRHLQHHAIATLAMAGADRIVHSLEELTVADVRALLA